MGLVYFSAICIVALFGGSYAQSPDLSPSYSFRATGRTTILGQDLVYEPYLVYNDANRGLLKLEFAFSISGQQTNANFLVNRMGDEEFITVNGQCRRTMSISQVSMPAVLENEDTWSKFNLVSTNGAVRTYTSGTNTLITTNALPTSLTYFVTASGQQTQVVLTIHSFTNNTPAFSVFQLDRACVEDGFTCENCYYNSFPSLSPNFSFQATGTTTTQGQTIILNPYLVYNDGFRGLLKLEFTSTVSGQQTTTNVLFSSFEDVEFTTTSDQCARTSASNQGSLSSVLNYADPWKRFALVNIVGDVRTYTSGTTTLITTNGVPTSLTFSVLVNGQSTQTTLKITSYNNYPPSLSVFQLDPACVAEGYSCGSCYNDRSSAIGIASNFVYIISALVILSILSLT